MVKLAIIPNDFYGKGIDFEGVVDLCASEGINFIELASLWGKSVLDLDDTEVERVRTILDEHGVKVVSIQTQIMKTIPPASNRRAKLAGRIIGHFYGAIGRGKMHSDAKINASRISDAIDVADALDAKYIVTYSYMHIFLKDKDRAWKNMVSSYKHLSAACESRGKVMVVECEPDTLVNDTGTYLKLINGVGSDALQINLDLANFISHGKSFTKDDFTRLSKYVPYMHVKDRIPNNGPLKKWLPTKGAIFGDGTIPWREVLPWFLKAGFNGVLSIEPHVFTGNKFEKGRECIRGVKALLDELGVHYA
ncbi:MAG: sugar phosphate isomerase/epimerase family protein [Promethearchaeota archaeon]